MSSMPTTDQPHDRPRPVYVLAQIAIHDRDRYDRYASLFPEVLKAHQGVLLAADERPVVLEGRWQWDKVVLVRFPDRGRFETWFSSPDYRRISADRSASTDAMVLLVRGLFGRKDARNDDLLRSC